MKIVFDSNVYIAAAHRHNFAERLLFAVCRSQQLQLYISLPIIHEIEHILQSRLRHDRAFTASFLQQVGKVSTMVYPRERITGVLADTNDHMVLECAVEAAAHCIVTADRGLLQLKQFRSIAIVYPSMMKFVTK